MNVDLRFGPFTCIAGANGVGKSNLFDAIGFLSALAEMPLMEAAKSVRGGRTADVASLFHRVGGRYDELMSFETEMIIPSSGADDLGQTAEATITFLRYTLHLSLRKSEENRGFGGLTIQKEELDHINTSDAKKSLKFPHTKLWRQSAVQGRRTVPFISTDDGTAGPIIQLHQDRGGSGGGRPAPFLASSLPRTVLSTVNAAENRTAVLARREMQSWRRLQLEPSALREPDPYATPSRLGSDGSHLAATLHHLAHGGVSDTDADSNEAGKSDPLKVYTRVANRLADLIEDVREVGIDNDSQRELWTLFALGKDGTKHSARSLSDGTLRFLALAVIELDPNAQGVICLEEPENGIHPERIPAMLKLLKEIAVNTLAPIGEDNPLRQVIINTHSPSVVSEIDEDSLIVAKLREESRQGHPFQSARFAALPDTWRTTGDEQSEPLQKGDVLRYLSGPRPLGNQKSDPTESGSDLVSTEKTTFQKSRRVIDRADLQALLNYGDDAT